MLHGPQHRITAYKLAEALAKHVLTSAGQGRYLQEQMLHCALFQPDRASAAVVVVLTGMRLLCVNSATWKMTLNLPLRKVQSVSREGGEVLLHLIARKERTPFPSNSASSATESVRRVACSMPEEVAAFETIVQSAVDATRSRAGNTWHKSLRDERGPLEDYCPPLLEGDSERSAVDPGPVSGACLAAAPPSPASTVPGTSSRGASQPTGMGTGAAAPATSTSTAIELADELFNF